MSGEEPVTSPDQHRPTISRRLARFGAVVTILALLGMLAVGNHSGHVEDIFVIGVAALIFLLLVIDVVLRKRGLRS